MGHIFFDFALALRRVRFTPHVVVATDTLDLLDVTPHNASGNCPFLQHHPDGLALVDVALERGPMGLIYR